MDKSGQNVPVARSEGHRFSEMNEAGLLVVAKRGETAAFNLLYRAYAGKILRTVHRITRNHEDAEDAVHDAFLRAFLHIQTFDGRSAFSTWLTRIGINSALMLLRKKRNSREVTPAKHNESESQWEATDSAPNPRSVEEMASEIGISVCAAKGRLFHAKAALRRSLALRSIRQRHEPATNRLRTIKCPN